MVKLRSRLEAVEVIAEGSSIHELKRLRKYHGDARWRKLKGVALIELPSARVVWAELHWYEAHGIGRKEMKIKRLLT